MSEKGKSLSRPKVRFSQKSSSPENVTDVPRLFNGPKIREIITLKKPVILIRPKEKNDTIKVVDHSKKEPDSISAGKIKKDSSPSKESVSTIDQLQKQTESLKISSDKLGVNLKTPEGVKSIESNLSSGKSSKSGDKSTVSVVKKTPQVIVNVLQTRSKSSELPGNEKNVVKSNSLHNISSKLKSDPIHRRSENKENSARKISSSRPLKVTPNKPESAVKSSKSLTVLSKSAPIKSPKKIVYSSKKTTVLCREPKIPVAGTMACLKSRRNSQKSPARKSVVRNRAVAPPNVYVGPGVPRTQSPRSPDAKELYKKPDVFSSNKLIKPEFNSIVNTMRKLEKTKKEKVGTDIDSLPATYKNFNMGKMSSALDFPASQPVFRNLVDISINENLLPIRMTRSKDPEPRQKDLVPNLSDFFTPQYCEEYTEACQIRPRTPEFLDNWSAFTISDRLNSWKNRLDDN